MSSDCTWDALQASYLAMILAEQAISLSNGLQQLQDCSMASRRLLTLKRADISAILLPAPCTCHHLSLTTPSPRQQSVIPDLQGNTLDRWHSRLGSDNLPTFGLLHLVSGILVAQACLSALPSVCNNSIQGPDAPDHLLSA